MRSFRLGNLDLGQLSWRGGFCGVPIGGGAATNMLGVPAPGEALSLTLAVAGFLGAGIWMFRKWGKSSDPVPEEAPESRPERGLATN